MLLNLIFIVILKLSPLLFRSIRGESFFPRRLQQQNTKKWLYWKGYDNNAQIITVSGLAVNHCIVKYSRNSILGDGPFPDDAIFFIFDAAYTIIQTNDDTAQFTFYNNKNCSTDIAQNLTIIDQYTETFDVMLAKYPQQCGASALNTFTMHFSEDVEPPVPKDIPFTTNFTYDHYMDCTPKDIKESVSFLSYRQDYCFAIVMGLLSSSAHYYAENPYATVYAYFESTRKNSLKQYRTYSNAQCTGVPRTTGFTIGECIAHDYIPNVIDFRPNLNQEQIFVDWRTVDMMVPTTQPTVRITSITPSIQPTVLPTIVPTHPTFAPSAQQVYKMSAEQTLRGISAASFDSDRSLSDQVFSSAVCDVLSFPLDCVAVLLVTDTETTDGVDILLLSAVVTLASDAVCSVYYEISINMWELTGTEHNNLIAAHTLYSDLLIAATSDNTFNQKLQQYSAQLHSSAMSNVTSDAVTVTPYATADSSESGTNVLLYALLPAVLGCVLIAGIVLLYIRHIKRALIVPQAAFLVNSQYVYNSDSGDVAINVDNDGLPIREKASQAVEPGSRQGVDHLMEMGVNNGSDVLMNIE